MTTATISLDQYASPDEAKHVRRLIDALLADPKTHVSVNDGEEWTVKRSRDRGAIIEALATTGSDTVRASMQIEDAGVTKWASRASFMLVYQGGDAPGDEVICDYSDNPFADAIWRKVVGR